MHVEGDAFGHATPAFCFAGCRPDDLVVDVVDHAFAHRRDGGDVIVRADQHHGIGLATGALSELVADIEQRALAQPGIDRRVAVRHDEMLQPGPVRRDDRAAAHIGEIERDEGIVGEIVQPHRPAVAGMQHHVRHALADPQRAKLGAHHRPVAGLIDVEPHAQHGAGQRIGQRAAGHRAHRVVLAEHVFARGFRHLARAHRRDRALLARIAVEQGRIGQAARHPGQPPRQADGVENAGIQAERPHRRDQMRGIAHQEDAAAPPFGRDAVMDAIDDGVDDLHVLHRADEAQDLLAELLARRLGLVAGERKQEAPAMRLANQDHPLGRIGEIGEIGIVARVLHIEIDLHVDQERQHVQRLALDRNAKLRADGAAAAVAGEEIGAFDLAQAVRASRRSRRRHRRRSRTTTSLCRRCTQSGCRSFRPRCRIGSR